MGDRTSIEWTEATWNPATGCTKVSPGCDHCYAERIARRFAGTKAYPRGFEPTLRPERLDQPLRWTRPRRIFVCSMADLFHDAVPDEYIAEVFAIMALAPQHTFQVLTKRHGRMRSLLNSREFRAMVARCTIVRAEHDSGPPYLPEHLVMPPGGESWWPLPNVWVGVSAEDQRRADLRIPALLRTPAAVRWISAEPLLGPIDLRLIGRAPSLLVEGTTITWERAIHWVVAGGESGRGARPMHPDWARGLRDQCAAAGVPFLYKQHGEWAPIGPLYDQEDDLEADEVRMEAAHLGAVERRTVVQLECSGYIAEGHQPTDPRTWLMARVGKKAAGRELDGVVHDGYPA
jgi:protein gp37